MTDNLPKGASKMTDDPGQQSPRSRSNLPLQARVPQEQLTQGAPSKIGTRPQPSGGSWPAYDVPDGIPLRSKIADTPEQQRLRTFMNWPLQAPVSKEQLAQGGFEHIGDLGTKCRLCGLVISDWQCGDGVVQRHRDASPECSFVRALASRPLHSAMRRPSVGGAEDVPTPTPSSQRLPTAEKDLFLQELKAVMAAYLDTFRPWLIPPEQSQAGFHYLPDGDKARCAFCQGVVHSLARGDDPMWEHARQYPHCPLLRNPALAGSHDNGGQNELGTLMSELPKLNISVHVEPKHPSLASSDARMRSFEKWPSTCPKQASELVAAGFFYIGLQHYTKCFHCDRGLSNWTESDDPWEEHARRFPRCQFVQLSKGEAYIEKCLRGHRQHLNSVAGTSLAGRSDQHEDMPTELEVLMKSDDVLSYLSQGVSVDTVLAALVHHMRDQSRGFASRDELLQVLGELPDLPRSSNGRTAGGQATLSDATTMPPRPPYLPDKVTGGNLVVVAKAGASSYPSPEPSELAEENLRLKQQWLCKLCQDVKVGVVFLPCGHLVACPACASAVTKCPVCQKAIGGLVRTFLS